MFIQCVIVSELNWIFGDEHGTFAVPKKKITEKNAMKIMKKETIQIGFLRLMVKRYLHSRELK